MMRRPRRTVWTITATLIGLGLAACSQPAFDASAPWVPMRANEGASFGGGVMGAPPSMGFNLFEQDRPETTDASVSVPRGGGENPWATPQRGVVVTLCYGGLINSAEEVRQAAAELCPPGSTPRFLGGDAFWNQCPLLQPNRAAFQCLPEDGESEESDGGTAAITDGQGGGRG
ncbi:hypothetical protein [Ferruginivarius sediminum]|uniref:Uncharacterized protein n=1 Tax=Ferruginivarius sediminum TaxID=2661937 RepID=A0A369T5Y7_9PROT|nr:hypothetical protein [Ferruginivarius sediminum]RDD60678.1 hypothetical protein DRB17_16570 [Ferruginivarius sediminum]